MWKWCDQLKLGTASAFVKREIRSLPQLEAEFETDFYRDYFFLDRDYFLVSRTMSKGIARVANRAPAAMVARMTLDEVPY